MGLQLVNTAGAASRRLAFFTNGSLSFTRGRDEAPEYSTQDSDQNLFLNYLGHPPDSYRDGIGCLTETTHTVLLAAQPKVFG